MNGYIKFFRQMLEWEWYGDANTMRLFVHCLLKANHKDKQYQGVFIKAGSFITGREKLSQELGLSVQQIRTSLTRLNSTNEITTKTTNKGTLITVVKWGDYQGVDDFFSHQYNQQSNHEVTSNQPATNQQVTTTNNDKNIKNDNNKDINNSSGQKNVTKSRKKFVPPTIEELTKYIQQNDYAVDPEHWLDYYETNGFLVGKTKMKDWKASVRTWNRNNFNKSKTKGVTSNDKVSNRTNTSKFGNYG